MNIYINNKKIIKIYKDYNQIIKGYIGINNIPKKFYYYQREEEESEELPNGYTKVEYIENNTTSSGVLNRTYIDTGINGNKTIICKFAINDITRRDSDIRYVLGKKSSSLYYTLFWSKSNISGYYSIINYGNVDSDNIRVVQKTNLNNEQIIEAKMKTENLLFNLDDFSNNADETNLDELNSYNYFLFACNNGNSIEPGGLATRIYECKIYNNPDLTGLVRNFIPCIENSTNTPGMYDTKYRNFYGNSNSNSQFSSIKFIAGPVIS